MQESLPNFPQHIYFRDGTTVLVRSLEEFHSKACHYDIGSDEFIPREWADTPDKFRDVSHETAQEQLNAMFTEKRKPGRPKK